MHSKKACGCFMSFVFIKFSIIAACASEPPIRVTVPLCGKYAIERFCTSNGASFPVEEAEIEEMSNNKQRIIL